MEDKVTNTLFLVKQLINDIKIERAESLLKELQRKKKLSQRGYKYGENKIDWE